MPLALLGPMVLVGVAAVVLLVHLLGGSRPGLMAGPEEAVEALARDFPAAAPRGAILADDGAAALVETDRGLGLVRTMGAGRMTRLLRHGEAAASERAGALRIRLREFGAPALDLRLADPGRRAEALALVRRVMGDDA